MLTNVASLTSLAARAASVSNVANAAPVAPARAGGADFGQVLAEMTSGAVDTIKASEATAISGVQGNASVQQVVTAIMSAEQTLQTAIAIRDKVIAAYQEISRMQI